jgi:hypothetical protein
MDVRGDRPRYQAVPAYRVGKRTRDNAVAFMGDLSERLTNRVQISSDALRSYVDAVERAFGADVDYGQWLNFTTQSRLGPAAMRPRACLDRKRLSSLAILTSGISRPAWLSGKT